MIPVITIKTEPSTLAFDSLRSDSSSFGGVSLCFQYLNLQYVVLTNMDL